MLRELFGLHELPTLDINVVVIQPHRLHYSLVRQCEGLLLFPDRSC